MTETEFIQVKARIRRTRTLKVAYNRAPGLKIPAIRFSGTYLEHLGFYVGGAYELTVNPDNSITLVAIPGDPSEDVADDGVGDVTP